MTRSPTRRPRAHRRALAALAALLPAAACHDGTGPRPSADLRAVLHSPHGAEGAAVLELTGGGVSGLAAEEGSVLFSGREGETVRVVVVRGAPGDVAFRLRVADAGRLPRATVREVADGADAVRPSTEGYAVRFESAGAP